MDEDGLVVEFGRFSRWLADAISELPEEDLIPASCRGTANPFLFEIVAETIGARPGMQVLDVGSGLGGPGRWLEQEKRCRTVGVDVMATAAAARLFPGSLYVAAEISALPFSEGTFDGAWALGVVEMIRDKSAALAEMARVLAPQARLGIYGFVSHEGAVTDPPSADHFVPPEELTTSLESVGFYAIDGRAMPDHSPAPQRWRDAVDEVRRRIERDHGGHPDYQAVQRELERFRALRRSGAIRPWLFTATRR